MIEFGRRFVTDMDVFLPTVSILGFVFLIVAFFVWVEYGEDIRRWFKDRNL